jgi:hypothetical protein
VTGLALLIGPALVAMSMIAGFVILPRQTMWQGMTIYCSALLLFGLLVELATAIYLRKHKTLMVAQDEAAARPQTR